MDTNTYAKIWCGFARDFFANLHQKGKELNLKVTHNRIGSNPKDFPKGCMSKTAFSKIFNVDSFECLSSTGGYTSVQVILNEKAYTAKHNFNKNEQFCRSFGTMVAVRKALSKSEEGLAALKTIDESVKNQCRAIRNVAKDFEKVVCK